MNRLKAGCCLFLFFLEGPIAAAKRCDQLVLEWNPNFLNFQWRQKLIQNIKSSLVIAVKYKQKEND